LSWFASARRVLASVGLVGVAFVVVSPSSCVRKTSDDTTYFDRSIAPILNTSCVRTNTGAGCHVADAKFNAFGNLDVSTYERTAKRRDLMLNYGPYGQAALLLKVVPNYSIDVVSFDGVKSTVTTDVKHTGGAILDPTANAYQTLRKWVDNGATANNTGVPIEQTLTRGPCQPNVIGEPGFDPNFQPTDADYSTFVSKVIPALKSCAAGNCHGTSANDLYLTCGDTPQQQRWNYYAATQYLTQTPEQSELARRPLSPARGGAYHEGGVIFETADDPGYQAIVEWAKQHGPAKFQNLDPDFLFFAHRVQPMLVKKGCMMVQCHSGAMFHDYRLRGGSGGSFSLSATKKNYDLSVQQLALESPDPNASRLLRKNLYRPEAFATGQGIVHRGGPLLEDFPGRPATPAECQNLDYDNGDLDKIPAYCMLVEWARREAAVRKPTPLSAIVWVQRSIPSGPDRVQDFDLYHPGADLRAVDATMGPNGIPMVSNERSLTQGCGLDKSSADIRRPAVSWDGKKIAFAARSSAGEPLAIYEMNADGSSCAKHADINAGAPMGNGLLIHNFDPQYSPADRDGVVRLVFSSTRGNTMNTAAFDYSGPQRTPSDPTKPNANLYVYEPDPQAQGKTRIRQLTFQLNVERMASFMADGRVIMTMEKRAPHFYQLALRRINLDGGDYHPLYGQRATIGNHEVTQEVELADKNFAAIFADPGVPHAGGNLGIFNRTIGIDFHGTDPKDYLIDPSVIDPNAPASPDPSFFIRSLRFPDGAASGTPGKPTSGVYASPSPLPGTKLLASWGQASDPASFGGDYDVVVFDPMTGARTPLVGAAGQMDVDAVAVYGKVSHGVFASRIDEPNGHTVVYPDKSEAEIIVVDTAMIGSLLFQNTPTGRALDTEIKQFDVLEELPPTIDTTSYGAAGAQAMMDEFGQLVVRRRKLGTVPLQADGSAKFWIPGGAPMVLSLPDTTLSKKLGLPRLQREEMSFYPGEYSHQSFKAGFFDALCGQCHGAVSGQQLDIAVRPDIMSQASNIAAKEVGPTNLSGPPAGRGPILPPPP